MHDFIKQNISSQFPFMLHQLENLDDAFLKKRHIPNKWSIHEHLAHLGRYQEIFLERMTVILEEDTPNLERYKAEEDNEFYKWCEFTTVDIITKALKARFEIIHLLKQLTPSQLNRIGIHPKLGSMTIEDWISFFMLHESHHIYAIFGLKQRFNNTENFTRLD